MELKSLAAHQGKLLQNPVQHALSVRQGAFRLGGAGLSVCSVHRERWQARRRCIPVWTAARELTVTHLVLEIALPVLDLE
jgi:hypothetical protein